jgi:DNA-binding MarR family transcriptional regulator
MMLQMRAAPDNLKHDIALNRPYHSLEEQLLLSVLATHRRMLQVGQGFFAAFDLTDAQFNLLMILWDHRRSPLSQTKIADLLLINRASAGALIQRMFGRRLIERRDDPRDQRAYTVTLSTEGSRLLRQTRGPYYRLLQETFAAMPKWDKRQLLSRLEQFRSYLNQEGSDVHA